MDAADAVTINEHQGSQGVTEFGHVARASLGGDSLILGAGDEHERQPRRLIRFYDVEPDLFVGVPKDRRSRAIASVTVPVFDVDAGTWRPPPISEGSLGLLITEGFLLRELSIADRPSLEVLGPGDLLWPDECIEVLGDSLIPRWRALTAGSVVSINEAATEWMRLLPAALPELVRRAQRRSQLPAFQAVLRKIRGPDRLLAVLRYFAGRWGSPTTGGLVIPFRLTHNTLADLVAVRRPTVTAHLHALTRRGVLRISNERHWIVGDSERSSLGDFETPSQVTASAEWTPAHERRRA